MKKINETKSISELLSNSAFSDTNEKINRVIKQSTIFSFWEDIVGKKFAKFTRPCAIKYKKLYVSAKNPAIIQELSLYKTKLLTKINSYSMPLGIEIKDIIFDYKNYNIAPDVIYPDEKPRYIKNSEIEQLKIDKETQDKITKTIEKIEFLNEKQRKNLILNILSSYKVKALQNNS